MTPVSTSQTLSRSVPGSICALDKTQEGVSLNHVNPQKRRTVSILFMHLNIIKFLRCTVFRVCKT